jgi:toxin YoeB
VSYYEDDPFVPKTFKEYTTWINRDRKTALRINDLIQDILRAPFEGIGKPEPLKHQFKGYWSRKIDLEHRLIYGVRDTYILIISCYAHYN